MDYIVHNPELIIKISSFILLCAGVLTFLLTCVITAPYGRHSVNVSKSWGPLMNAQFAWVFMEVNSIIFTLL